MADEHDEDYESVSAMADRLKLKGRDRQRYVHEHMTGLGYKMQPSYVRADPDDDDDDERDKPRFVRRSREGGSSRRRSDNDWY